MLVIYDSNYGNTKLLAEIMAKELGKKTRVVKVDEMNSKDLEELDLLVVGSPIIGWRPTEKMGGFLTDLKSGQLRGVKAAAFDTRVKVWFSGNAAKKIAAQLEKAGAKLISDPEAFYVAGREGPLVDGEEKRALEWIKGIRR